MSNVKVPVCPTCGGRVMILCREDRNEARPPCFYMACHDCQAKTPKRFVMRDALGDVEWLPMDAQEG